MYTPDTPLWQLTVSEFVELHKKVVAEVIINKPIKKDKRYVYGIAGLAKVINCSERKAQELKNSGRIDPAISQDGRKIIVDADKVIELLKIK